MSFVIYPSMIDWLLWSLWRYCQGNFNSDNCLIVRGLRLIFRREDVRCVFFFATSQSCSKAGRTMDAVSAFRKSSNVKSQKTLQKRKLSYAKKKKWNTARGLWTFWLHWEVGSWKAESRFVYIFSFCPYFGGWFKECTCQNLFVSDVFRKAWGTTHFGTCG